MLKALDDLNKALKREGQDGDNTPAPEHEVSESERKEKVLKAIDKIQQERRDLLEKLAE
ncbi:MAG TPA: hypothetical protein VFC63_04160 [Blastocatellia bacterium]|nr:hypothetical protein [Blastocatellia bacterium]